jgi:uncharacterized protein (TIGR02270 family)
MPPLQPAPADAPTDRSRPTGVIPEVCVRHLEEFRFLWEQRRTALSSPDLTLRDVGRLEERMKAHLEGLLLTGVAAVPVLEAGLAGDDPSGVFASAYVLLSLRDHAAAERVTEAFRGAEADKLDGFREALCQGSLEMIEPALRDAVASAPATHAAAALEALAFHHRPDPGIDRLVEFLQHESPHIRCIAWRIMALMGTVHANHA